MVDGFEEFCNGTLWASISIWNSESSLKPLEKLLNLNIECQQVNGLCVNMSNDCTLNACKHLLCNWHVLIEGLNPNWNHLYKNYTDLSIALNDVLLEKNPDNFMLFLLQNETLLLNNYYPQFTDCFQNTLLVWVPCGFLWATLPFYLPALLSSKDDDVPPVPLNWLNVSKSVGNFLNKSYFHSICMLIFFKIKVRCVCIDY